jgi:hypothetical protein
MVEATPYPTYERQNTFQELSRKRRLAVVAI